ncbi:hypothetical protein D3C72_2228930 [compost metagenome]
MNGSSFRTAAFAALVAAVAGLPPTGCVCAVLSEDQPMATAVLRIIAIRIALSEVMLTAHHVGIRDDRSVNAEFSLPEVKASDSV